MAFFGACLYEIPKRSQRIASYILVGFLCSTYFGGDRKLAMAMTSAMAFWGFYNYNSGHHLFGLDKAPGPPEKFTATWRMGPNLGYVVS